MTHVHIDYRGRVALITLDDPDRRNALSLGLCDELADKMASLEDNDDVGAVVITGAGRAFCAGADLSELGKARDKGLLAIYEGFLAVARSSLPTIAAVNGAAVGAGFNLALACDVRIAANAARFDCRFLNLGIHPGGGHTWMLHRAVGPQTAAAMLLFGEVLDGPAALEAGLAWACVDDAELIHSTVTLADRAASVPVELARETKATLRQVASIDAHDDAVDLELEKQVASMDRPAFTDRLRDLKARVSPE